LTVRHMAIELIRRIPLSMLAPIGTTTVPGRLTSTQAADSWVNRQPIRAVEAFGKTASPLQGCRTTQGQERVMTTTGESRVPRGNIVIAEDDEATRMLLCAVLTRAQFTVRAFENGKLACEAVRSERPDVILLDWSMPVMDGPAAIQLLKADEETRGIPIVMLTTHSQIEDRVVALEAGVQDFLSKPFDARELIARIEQQMRWRKVLAIDANAAFAAERLGLYRGSETRNGKHTETAAGGPDFFDRIWGSDQPKKSKQKGFR
jgi:CheY-like chemotaxis protein